MKTFKQLVAEVEPLIQELMPWDLEELQQQSEAMLLVDIREPAEFTAMHIQNSINVPRGILESACDYDYSETEPVLASARDQKIILICRSGNRSALAAHTLQLMGYKDVSSLKTGLRGWNDYEQALIDSEGNAVNIDDADDFLSPPVREEQRQPKD